MVVEQYEAIEADLPTQAERNALPVYDREVSIEDVHFWIFGKCSDDVIEATSTVAVVGVEPPNDVSTCPGKSFVQCLALASIGPRFPADV
jgi:hypothetical protein